jgi:hypothetical protein
MRHSGLLKLSILLAIGAVPAACSGEDAPEPDTGEAGAGGMAGTGTTSGGKSNATAGKANSPGGMGGEGGTPTGITRGCTHAEPRENGLVYCADQQYFTRPRAVACGSRSEGGEGGGGGVGGAGPELPRASGNKYCRDDDDCAEFELGYCTSSLDSEDFSNAALGVGGAANYCRSGCVVDDDCGEHQVCLCEGPKGVCVASDCRQDSDCGAGVLGASVELGCEGSRLLCQSAADECGSHLDCPESDCGYNEPGENVGVRECGALSVCGRPFLVAAAARLPPATSRDDWRDGLAPRVDHLTADERAALARHWTKLGQMEHASIAAFARFQLQLLALGAPPALVEQCTQALADETGHTKLCFGLASAYAGHAIGPGPLDVSHSLEETSLVSVVDLVLVEGCFGETSAALEALESAETAVDPVIRGAYVRIAQDEQRHAELAFRFVKWALEQEREVVGARVALALRAMPAAVADVAGPCLEALLAPRLAA